MSSKRGVFGQPVSRRGRVDYAPLYKTYGELFSKIARGKLPEMFSSVALTGLVKKIYKPGMKLLDVACGAGHYLRSLRKRVDPEIRYLGVDFAPYYVELARKAYGEKNLFRVGSIFDIPVESGGFDIVMSNNVLLHLPPNPVGAIRELLRASRRYVVIRTLIGKRNYIIQKVRTAADLGANHFRKGALFDFEEGGGPLCSEYYNMYTRAYFEHVVSKISAGAKVRFIEDKAFPAFDNRRRTDASGTRVWKGMQIAGNLIMNWYFVLIDKNTERGGKS